MNAPQATLVSEIDLARFEEGAAVLLKAWLYAHDVKRPVLDYAVEVRRLRDSGISECELRWLLHKAFIEHFIDRSTPDKAGRILSHIQTLGFSSESCFVLTEQGLEFAWSLVNRTNHRGGMTCDNGKKRPMKAARNGMPVWDSEMRELRVGRQIVKVFRVLASDQELVLKAFQQIGWKRQIDNPFPAAAGINPKNKRRSVIQALMRNQRPYLIHFFADGYGLGICWEFVKRRTKKRG